MSYLWHFVVITSDVTTRSVLAPFLTESFRVALFEEGKEKTYTLSPGEAVQVPGSLYLSEVTFDSTIVFRELANR